MSVSVSDTASLSDTASAMYPDDRVFRIRNSSKIHPVYYGDISKRVLDPQARMKINPAIAFTLILLAMMVGAGIVSSSWGYALGRQALTGVRQPEARPSSASTANRNGASNGNDFVLMKEDDILKNVKARIEGGLETAE